MQNSSQLDKQTREGNTPLHYCVIQNQCESMRLLLRSGANPCVENNNGKTPIDIAKERGHHLCEEMVRIYIFNSVLTVKMPRREGFVNSLLRVPPVYRPCCPLHCCQVKAGESLTKQFTKPTP